LGFPSCGCCDPNWLLGRGGQQRMARPWICASAWCARWRMAPRGGRARPNSRSASASWSSCCSAGGAAARCSRIGSAAGNRPRSRRMPSGCARWWRRSPTLAELRHRLAAEGIAVSRSGLGRFLLAAGLTRKKDTARRRAGPSGRRRGARDLAGAAAGDEPGTAGIPRRDLGLDQHGVAPRPSPARAAGAGGRAARPLTTRSSPRCAMTA
jgi:hypothetical protein